MSTITTGKMARAAAVKTMGIITSITMTTTGSAAAAVTGLTESCPVAIPHTSSDHVKRQSICALRLEEPVAFRQIDDDEAEMQARFVLNLALLNDHEHIDIMMNLIHFLKDRKTVEEMEQADLDGLSELLRKNILLQ